MDRQPTPETNYTGPKVGEVFSIPDGEILAPAVKSLGEVQARRAVHENYPAQSPEMSLTDEQRLVLGISRSSRKIANAREAALSPNVPPSPDDFGLAA